jgi:hypothetical protein
MSNQLSREIFQHLQNAKGLIANKIESWRGREPFPGDAEKAYRQMLSDVNYELHEYEVVEGPQPKMSAHLAAVLVQYRTLLDDTTLFWAGLDNSMAASYESILKNLDGIMAITASDSTAPVPPVMKRPNVRCVEHGRCRIKVEHEESRSQTPTQNDSGQWVFDDPLVYRENRSCLTCERQWTTSVNHGQVGTVQIKAPTRIML